MIVSTVLRSSPVCASGVGSTSTSSSSHRARVAVRASARGGGREKSETITGLVFEPMKEVQMQLKDQAERGGFAKYFRDQSLEERGHAQKLIDFQNTRGGRVRLLALVPPETEFTEDSRGDALYAMELSLSLERLNYDKLLHLWDVMEEEADAQASHFIEYMLEEQAADIKETADYVSQLRRVGKGHGVWHFDHELYEKEVRYMAYAGSDAGSNGA
ncbi:hypothetical protein Ndes2526A_g01280 [Nannochloris sp. 'desiccata']